MPPATCVRLLPCLQVVANMNVQGLGFRWGCVQRASTADCINAVKGGQAEALTADGGDIYAAQKPENSLKVGGWVVSDPAPPPGPLHH